MADENKVVIEVVKHANIYGALAAFQAENPKIERTKKVEFGEGAKKVEFWYSPLDEVLSIVRPLTAKHGIAITWEEGKKEGTIICALYHETYSQGDTTEEYDELIYRGALSDKEVAAAEGNGESHEPKRHITRKSTGERNVIRSMPITVKRSGDMKGIGSDSTYARRYTLAEVLGIAPDEDNDVAAEAARLEKVEDFAFKQAKTRVTSAKDVKTLTEQATFFDKELLALANGKTSSLGFTKEQYDELMGMVAKRKAELERGGVGKGAPGDNKDGNGEAALPLGDK